MNYKVSKALPLLLVIVFFSTACSNNIFNESEGFKTVNGHKIHYKVSGKGSPIVLLHGGYLDLDIWNNQVRHLNTKGFKTIRYSELGHGKTIRDTSNTTEGYKIIDEFVSEFTNEKVTIIGLSWGGTLAVDYVLKYPEKVNRIVLVSSGLKDWKWVQDTVAKKTFKLRKEAVSNNDTLRASELFYKNWVIGPKREKANINGVLESQIRNTILSNLKNHWGEQWSSIPQFTSIEDLNRINKKTLILLGEEDLSDIHSICKIYKTNIKDSRLVKFIDTGHLLNIEKTELFNKTVIDFLLEKQH